MRRGFTIPELSISLAIMMMIMAVFLSFFMLALKFTQRGSFLSEVSQGLTESLRLITFDLASLSSNIYHTGGNDVLIYTDRTPSNFLEVSWDNRPAWFQNIFNVPDVVCLSLVTPDLSEGYAPNMDIPTKFCWGGFLVTNDQGQVLAFEIRRAVRFIGMNASLLNCDSSRGRTVNQACVYRVSTLRGVPRELLPLIRMRADAKPLMRNIGLEIGADLNQERFNELSDEIRERINLVMSSIRYSGIIVAVKLGVDETLLQEAMRDFSGSCTGDVSDSDVAVCYLMQRMKGRMNEALINEYLVKRVSVKMEAR